MQSTPAQVAPVQGYAVPAQGQQPMAVQGKTVPVQGQPVPVMGVPVSAQLPPKAGAMPVTAVATTVMPIMPVAPPINAQFSHGCCSFECCSRTCMKGHCLMAWFCPCFLFARLAEHEGLQVQDSYPQGGWGPKLRVLLSCFFAFFLLSVVRMVQMAMVATRHRGVGFIVDITRFCIWCTIVVIVMQLRELYRIKNGITNPTDCCGSSDCCCAWFCLPCTAQQMADNSFGDDAPCGSYLFQNPSTPLGRRPDVGPGQVANDLEIAVAQTGNVSTQ